MDKAILVSDYSANGTFTVKQKFVIQGDMLENTVFIPTSMLFWLHLHNRLHHPTYSHVMSFQRRFGVERHFLIGIARVLCWVIKLRLLGRCHG